MSDWHRCREYARSQREQTIEELKQLVRFASVSAQVQYAQDVRACARWLFNYLKGIGLHRVRLQETSRHPIVCAEWLQKPDLPTLLVYGHYDVQPVDPISAWRTPPFEALVRGKHLYGRGASDDKGQLFTHLKAIEACLKTVGNLPLNVRVVLEGEEEIGSPGLQDFLESRPDAAKADVAVVSDMRILGPDRPAITYGLRGNLAVELQVFGPNVDLHSGNFGGAVHNPLQALAEIIASLHDRSGRVAIQGFYDDVQNLRPRERTTMKDSGPTDVAILRSARTSQPWGEPGYSLYERTTLRPALTINGITGGYQGKGAKSVIPSTASAKLSFRLVPQQEPLRVLDLLRRHLQRVTPNTVNLKLRRNSHATPVQIHLSHPAVRAAAWAYEQGFGRRPAFIRSGGTIPVVATFVDILKIPTALMGFALPSDSLHAPNERFYLPNLFRGIETSLAFMFRLSRFASGELRPDSNHIIRCGTVKRRRV